MGPGSRRSSRLSRLIGSERRQESRLVWIFGSPRSGSTWLLGLLIHPLMVADDAPLGARRHPAAHAGSPRVVAVNEPYIPQHLAPPLFSDHPSEMGLAEVTLNSFRHGSPSYLFNDRYASTWRPALRRLVLDRLGAQAAELGREFGTRAPLVAIKEPNGSAGADLVLSLFPRSRLIFLLRDGRDIVDSMIDAQAPGGWLQRTGAASLSEPTPERLELVRLESELWRARTSAVKRAFDSHPEALRRLVRYEDVRRDPAVELSGLDAWLGTGRSADERASAIAANDFDAYPAEAKGRGMPLRFASPGLWREHLSVAEQTAMTEIMGETLRTFGYAV